MKLCIYTIVLDIMKSASYITQSIQNKKNNNLTNTKFNFGVYTGVIKILYVKFLNIIMKNQILILIAFFFLTSALQLRAGEQEQKQSAAEQAMAELMHHAVSVSSAVMAQNPVAECKIVIIDSSGKRIREERIADGNSSCTSSTLTPIIFRCELLTVIGNTRYYLLPSNAPAEGRTVKSENIPGRRNFQPAI